MLSDEAIYERLLAGDLGAFDLLYERYEKPLFGFIMRFVGNRIEAEDLFHETFMAVIKEREAGRSATSFRAWLYQVARHRCLNHLRSNRRAKAFVQSAESAAHFGDLTDNEHPEKAIQAYEAVHSLRLAVARLPEALAELFQLRSRGLSYDEISQVLEIPVGTVKSRMHQMVAFLRDEVQQ